METERNKFTLLPFYSETMIPQIFKSCFMKKLAIKCTCTILVVMLGFSGFSQDIHFSQFFETPLLRNPALAGIFGGDLRIQGVYRNQWNSVTVPYQTGSLNAEYKLPVGRGDDFLSIGV